MDIRRTRSLAVLPSYSPRDRTYGLSTVNPVSSSPSFYTVRRVLSLPELYPYKYSLDYRPTAYRYYRDWNVRGDYAYDRRYYGSSRYWPTYSWPYRRYYLSHLDHYYPSSYHYYRPNYHSSWYDRPSSTDYFDTWYWKRRLDPHWYRPWSYNSWPSYRPWAYESAELDRGWDMYRKGMISYDTLDRYYVSSSTWSNRYSDYLKPYKPPISYSSHPHYMYSIDYR